MSVYQVCLVGANICVLCLNSVMKNNRLEVLFLCLAEVRTKSTLVKSGGDMSHQQITPMYYSLYCAVFTCTGG